MHIQACGLSCGRTLTYRAVTGLNLFSTGVKWSQFPVNTWGKKRGTKWPEDNYKVSFWLPGFFPLSGQTSVDPWIRMKMVQWTDGVKARRKCHALPTPSSLKASRFKLSCWVWSSPYLNSPCSSHSPCIVPKIHHPCWIPAHNFSRVHRKHRDLIEEQIDIVSNWLSPCNY